MYLYLRTIHHAIRHPMRYTRASLKLPKVARARYFSESTNPKVPARGIPHLTPTTLVIGIIPLLTFALGTWQVKRLRWKLDLIEQIDDQAHRPPLELPDFVNLDALSEFAYRKFLLKGKWDHSRSIIVGPKTHDGVNGYHVVTPLVREGGSTILVDRGFVSRQFVSAGHDLQTLHEPQGEVEVQGMLRPQLSKNMFTPDNIPEKGEWYWLDVEGMKEWFGGDKQAVQSLLIEELFEGHSGEAANLISRGVPVGRPEKIELRNMHTTYALTWYSLSVATGIMFVRLLRRPHPFTTRLRTR